MKRLLLILAVIAACIGAVSAQNPIRWRMSVKMDSETEGTVTLRALLEPGWHLYGTSMPADGPKPTTFEFKLNGVALSGKLTASKPTVKRLDPMFGTELNWWESNVEFVQHFTLTERAGARISATVSFMGCNDATCLPPKSQTLTYNFK